jgi:1-acyl-sn-glycerol-3-phosphate acyltransferase
MSKSYSPTWRLISVIVLRPLLHLLVRNKWQGRENIPRTGGIILAPNHLSYADWGTDCLFFYECGRYPTFLIKASAFEVKGIGPFLHKAGQLPVNRGRADAALVLREAEKALAAGAAVVIYPESTATRDPDLWPMVAKTGAARLALATGAPVIPVARWGTQDVLPYGSKKVRLFPRKTVRTVAGPPVDLSQWAGQQTSARALRAATVAIMADITALVAQLRGEQPPAVPYDPAAVSRTDRAGSAAVPPTPADGAAGDDAPGDGAAGNGARAAGAETTGAETTGAAADGTSADGTSADGTSADGTGADGTGAGEAVARQSEAGQT